MAFSINPHREGRPDPAARLRGGGDHRRAGRRERHSACPGNVSKRHTKIVVKDGKINRPRPEEHQRHVRERKKPPDRSSSFPRTTSTSATSSSTSSPPSSVWRPGSTRRAGPGRRAGGRGSGAHREEATLRPGRPALRTKSARFAPPRREGRPCPASRSPPLRRGHRKPKPRGRFARERAARDGHAAAPSEAAR